MDNLHNYIHERKMLIRSLQSESVVSTGLILAFQVLLPSVRTFSPGPESL